MMDEIFLRALEPDDFPLTHQWHADQELYQTLVGPFRFVSLDAEKEYLEKRARYSNQEINLVICLVAESRPIGMISLREIDWLARKAHLTGIFIGEAAFRNRGYGSAALALLLRHCFEDLGLNRIWTLVLSDNQPSIRTFEKCGFQVEGCLRQHAFKGSQFKDVLLLGLTDDQFAGHRA